jgi:hypothetical protein
VAGLKLRIENSWEAVNLVDVGSSTWVILRTKILNVPAVQRQGMAEQVVMVFREDIQKG